jgi:hypothetical protein
MVTGSDTEGTVLVEFEADPWPRERAIRALSDQLSASVIRG